MTPDETFIGPIGPAPEADPTTLRRLNPGGKRPGGTEPPRSGNTGEDARLWNSLRLEKLNPIVAAAAPLRRLFILPCCRVGGMDS